jgi:tRNA uracil 4-sulfurtransferase
MKGLLLLSAGIDSPVAGYLMKKKMDIVAIHFDNQPLINKLTLDKVEKLAKKLGIKKTYIVEHGKNQIEIIKNCDRRYQCVLCRRVMFKIAEQIAKEEKCNFLITGENLGQVASQTLENMYVTEQGIKIKILQPLLCNDKQETIDLAKKIGTYDISIEAGMCCTAVPPNPTTKARLDKVLQEEKKIKIKKIVKVIHA